MQGYDAEKALAFIRKSIPDKPFLELGPQIEGYIRQAQTLDMQFMQDNAVIGADGYAGDGYYDDDEAFEYIVEEIVHVRGLSDEQAVLVASLVDAYMGAQDAFMRKEGLVSEE